MGLLSITWHYFWFAQAILYPALLVVLVRRGLQRAFPLFCLYVGYNSLHTITLLGMNYTPAVSGNQYYTADAVSTAVLAALSLGAVYELFRHAFGDYLVLRHFGTRSFRWGILILMAIATGLAWSAPASGDGHLMSVFYLLKRTMNLLLCGLLVLLFVCLRYFKLSWKSYPFAIALGFGILASANLAAYAIRSQIEPIARSVSTDILDIVSQGAALCSVIVWLLYALLPQPGSNAPANALPEHDLETWNRELERLLHP
jgi:hypothetical protein